MSSVALIVVSAVMLANKPYIDTATKLNYLADNVAAGEDYGGKYFKLTRGNGSDVKNIGNNFKGIATLGAGVKVSFNGGATIEAVSGEISFNANDSTFDSLDSSDDNHRQRDHARK